MSLSSLPLAASHPTLTAFFSVQYMALFLLPFLLVYALCPQRFRRYWLLLSSFGFFWLVSGTLIIYLMLCAVCVYGLGLLIARLYQKRDEAVKAAQRPERKALKKKYQLKARWVLAAGSAVNIGTLLTLKYSGFFMENVNRFLGATFRVPQFVMPIGISFFTLQAFSYLFDVYREAIQADRNPLRVTLFLAFFPQIVEGPICRYGQTAQSLWDAGPLQYENLVLGGQRILYGMLKKMVVADRLNALVETIFNDYANYQGGIIALGALCYTVQLYMDFSGSMDAVVGIGQMIGVTMPENFKRPFFSRTISEFWTRWHISLGTWFKDYIFYPVTMSKPMKNLTTAARKKLGNHFGPLIAGSIALFCVWFCNGLWHGAAWGYLFFGMYHFAFILLGNILSPGVHWLQDRLHIDPEHPLYRGAQVLRTCILVVIGELFFRAESLGKGLAMFRRMVSDFNFSSLTPELMEQLQIDVQDFVIVALTLVIVLVVGLFNERGANLRAELRKKNIAVRWAVVYAVILYIVIFGAYGKGYIPVDPMYANF